MTVQTTDALKKFILHFSQQCINYARESVMGYIDSQNIEISMQQMNQAFTCIKIAESYYYQNSLRQPMNIFESFLYQFETLNEEFLSAIRLNNDLTASVNEFRDLELSFNTLKEYARPSIQN